MRILGIESSCDDTSVALVEANEYKIEIISEKTASQIEVHKKYGGVVPEIAGRKHAENIIPVLEEVMNVQAKPDVIAVTSGPGLITGLLAGVTVAKTLSYMWNVPLVGVNHIEGHIHSVEIGLQTSDFGLQYPALALIVSGGHTELILIEEERKMKKIGATVDDAAGECFDKVATLLGFDYPGGPMISKFGLEGDNRKLKFPRPMIKEKNFDFSFSGLKTSALYWLRANELSAVNTRSLFLPSGVTGIQAEPPTINDFCASFEQAIVDVLVAKTLRAAKKFTPKSIILAGGVSANKKLRKSLQQTIKNNVPCSSLAARPSGFSRLLVPSLKYCMDNAAMIAIAGYHHAKKNDFTPWQYLQADPNWEIE